MNSNLGMKLNTFYVIFRDRLTGPFIAREEMRTGITKTL